MSDADRIPSKEPGWRAGAGNEDDVTESPKRLAHYEVREILGRGGMGVVYLGHDTRFDRDVALKFLSDGAELFYRNQDAWMAVAIPKDPQSTPGAPRILFRGPYLNIPGMSYDYDEANDRFLLLRGTDESPVTDIRVVLNWFEEVRARVDAEDN